MRRFAIYDLRFAIEEPMRAPVSRRRSQEST
jgi:hypothetical protein